jgi:hypothetical protein
MLPQLLEAKVEFRPEQFLQVWDKIIFGMVGIFVVVLAIIGVTVLLNKLTERKKK